MSETVEKRGFVSASANLLLETLDGRWQKYQLELKRCRSDPGEEAVHDLRVSTRRLLALIDLFRDLASHPRLQKLSRALKSQLDDFDDLRDTQVILMEIAATLADLPKLAAFQAAMLKREKRLLKATTKVIKSFKLASIERRMDFVYKTLVVRAWDGALADTLLQSADDAFAGVLRRYERIDTAEPPTIHRTRVAFKKFRYTAEIVFPLAPNFPVDDLKTMHDYQTLMGNIQDMEVFLAVYENFAEKHPKSDPEPVRRYFQQKHTETIALFVEDMHRLHTFWRPASDAPFPWDAKPGRKKSPRTRKVAELLPEQETSENGKQAEVQKEANG